MLQLLDPVTGEPHPAHGQNGKLVLSKPANAKVITPDNTFVYDPPIEVWIGDNTAVNVTVVPYGKAGDPSVTYPLAAGMGGTILPVLCKQVKLTGTTAATIIGHW
jgi:hypothetical protein